MNHSFARLRILRPTLLVIAAFSTSWLAAAPAFPPASPPAAELYFKPPQFTAPAISPDGRSLGFIAQSEGRACVFKLDRTTGQIQTVFSAGEGEIERFWWIGNKRMLISARGVRAIEYFVQELSGGNPRPIRALTGWSSSWILVMPGDTDHVVALNERVDLNTGHSANIENMTADYSFVYSRSGELRAKVGQAMGKWRISWRGRANQPWHSLESSNESWPAFTPAGIADDDRRIFVYANDQGDTEVLMLLDPDTDKRTLVAQRPRHDISGMVWQQPEWAPVGVEFYNNGPEDAIFLGEPARQLSAALDRSLPGMLHHVSSSSTDGTIRVVSAWLPGYPLHYYLFDETQHRLSALGEQRPEIAAGALGETHFFQFKTRDGLDESGYVLLPRQENRPKPIPLIVMAMQSVGEPAASAEDFDAQDQFSSDADLPWHIWRRGAALAMAVRCNTRGIFNSRARSSRTSKTGSASSLAKA